MVRILITSGPTRQYLDPVRYLTNASSGRMGAALAAAALELGHDVLVVTGPVQVVYPSEAEIIEVVTTQEMLETCRNEFLRCDGAIGAAAPCDYQPQKVESQNMSKTGQPLELRLVETPDIIATLGQIKREGQWVVGFALETDDRRFRATVKLEKKHCDLIVSNGPEAINAAENQVELIGKSGELLAQLHGEKEVVAREILMYIQKLLIDG
jgi:phosphopantothenoylcysteine decarboxylase / phosphopantothenate---cysteine ligase